MPGVFQLTFNECILNRFSVIGILNCTSLFILCVKIMTGCGLYYREDPLFLSFVLLFAIFFTYGTSYASLPLICN